jgi:hypothetical protein
MQQLLARLRGTPEGQPLRTQRARRPSR